MGILFACGGGGDDSNVEGVVGGDTGSTATQVSPHFQNIQLAPTQRPAGVFQEKQAALETQEPGKTPHLSPAPNPETTPTPQK